MDSKSRLFRFFVIVFCYFLVFSSPSPAQVSPEEKIFEFHPSFSVSEQYQDNVRQEAYDRRQEDFNVLWRPGVELKYNGERHSHKLDYFSNFIRYNRLYRENTDTHHVDLTNTLMLGSIIQFTVNTTDDYRFEQQDLRQTERKNNYLETNVFAVNPTLRINVLENTSLVGFYTFSRTSILDEDREDYLSNTFGGSLNRQLSENLELFAGFRYIEQDFLENTPDLIDQTFFAGLNWNITSSLRLEGEYGFNSRRYERITSLVTETTTENDLWEITLRNDVTETTHVDISYSQSQDVREISNTEITLVKTVSANLRKVLENLLTINLGGGYSEEDYEFTDRRDIESNIRLEFVTGFSEKISFLVGGNYSNNYYWPIGVREHVYDYWVGINLRILEWLNTNIRYEHRETDNNGPEGISAFRNEYLQNIVTITLTASF